ncbi:hypothetical protein Salat_2551700 [Sesamum alatum]|uniref:GRF-type domain-containing protein n=1 Tax=Sesamum alatum TaxID=300844 RepID=A0AAE2CCP4_9LAMI|nr:hypothetical protein Salat_2551700 [Sesamum alatum]
MSNRTTSSSTRRGTTYASSSDSPFQTCNCGEPVVMRTSWTSANLGRRFRGCSGYRLMKLKRLYCGIFEWIDPPMCPRAMEIIPGLLKRISRSDSKLKELNKELANVESMRRRATKIILCLLVVWVITIVAMKP